MLEFDFLFGFICAKQFKINYDIRELLQHLKLRPNAQTLLRNYQIGLNLDSKLNIRLQEKILLEFYPISVGAVLGSKLVDGRFQVQSLVALVDLAFLEFSVFFFRSLRKYGLESLWKTPHGGQSPYRSISHKRTIGLKLTNN